MAARRLLIVMLVLLGVSTLAAALVPTQRSGQGTTTTETTEESLPEDTLPSGKLFKPTTILIEGRTVTRVPIEVGDQLRLLVRAPADSKIYDQVEIPKLGLVDAVDPFKPARFDILAVESGTFSVRLVAAKRVVGQIEVSEPGSRPKAEPQPEPETS